MNNSPEEMVSPKVLPINEGGGKKSWEIMSFFARNSQVNNNTKMILMVAHRF
jgi:hypothetical protein